MVKLMEHQKQAIERLDNGKVLCGGVGTGKSLTVLAYYMEREAPRDIYVITTPKKRDSLEWEGEAIRFGISTDELTQQGRLHIDSWNNIGKYVDVEDAFFVFDEQRVIGMGMWSKSFIKIAKKNRWILLSATPGDTWLDYVPVFIANGLYRNATQFKEEHVVYAPFSKYPKVMRYTNVDILEKHRNFVLIDMPFPRHTTRHEIDVIVGHDKDQLDGVMKRRWHIFEDRPIKDAGELFRVMRKVVNTDVSRLNAVRALMEDHPRLIVFYNWDYELDILRELSDSVTVAEWNGHNHQQIPKTEKWVYLVQYTSGAEGWNCVETDAMVFYSLPYSWRIWEQCKGRIDRLNTDFIDLYYFILMSNSVVCRVVRKKLTQKGIFNEAAWVRKNFGNQWQIAA